MNTPANRCIKCNRSVAILESFRDPTEEECERYPTVRRHHPRVASASCECGLVGLAIDWDDERMKMAVAAVLHLKPSE